MATKVSSFLHGEKKREKAHHLSKAKSHDGHSEDHAKLAELHEEAGDKDIAKCHKSLSKRHAADAEEHRNQADACDGAMAECDKVAGDELNKSASDLIKRLEVLENTVVPTRVSAVAPNAPGLTAVPRAGQRPVGDRPVVPVQFAKLVEIEE